MTDGIDNITYILCRSARSCNFLIAKRLHKRRRALANPTPLLTRSRRNWSAQVLLPYPELSNTFKHRKPNVPLKTPLPEDKKSVASEEWPNSNKRRYLKNYQLPKINSPTKLRREELT